jgi:hypothetical protein
MEQEEEQGERVQATEDTEKDAARKPTLPVSRQELDRARRCAKSLRRVAYGGHFDMCDVVRRCNPKDHDVCCAGFC